MLIINYLSGRQETFLKWPISYYILDGTNLCECFKLESTYLQQMPHDGSTPACMYTISMYDPFVLYP